MIVLDKDLTTPPGSPADGDAYLIVEADSGTPWTGHDGEVATWYAAGCYWRFYAPSPGWEVFCLDDYTSWIQVAFKAPWDWYKTAPTPPPEPQTSFEFLMVRGSSNPVVGDVVYCSEDGKVDKAKADAAATMPAIGIVTSIGGGVLAMVRVLGLYNGLTGILNGEYYYVSATTAGAITTVKPASPPNVQQVFCVGLSASAILINPAPGSNA